MNKEWLALDARFPAFTGKEKKEDQIKLIQDYLLILKQTLRYILRNLSIKNFSSAGLEELTNEATAKLAQELQTLRSQLSSVAGTVGRLGSRLTGAEEEITYLQRDVLNLLGRVDNLEEADNTAQVNELSLRMDASEELQAAMDDELGVIRADLDKLLQVVRVAEDGSVKVIGREKADGSAGNEAVTIGGENSEVSLLGNVRINGILQGEESV